MVDVDKEYERGIRDLSRALTDSKFVRFNYGVTPEHLASVLRDFDPLHIVKDDKEYLEDNGSKLQYKLHYVIIEFEVHELLLREEVHMVHQRLNSVGTRVRQIREEKGWTTTELAKKMGVPKQTIYKYERDITKNVPYTVVMHLAEVLEVNPAYLVGWPECKDVPDDIVFEGHTTEEFHSDLI